MPTVVKQHISDSIQAFAKGNLTENALNLFKTLGYNTERQAQLEKPSREAFKDSFVGPDSKFNEEKALYKDWEYVDLLFQLSKQEIESTFKKNSPQKTFEFNESKQDGYQKTIIESYLFFCLELKKDQYTRTELSRITREVNRLFPMPVMILFKTGDCLTLSVINRRLHKKDDSKDVLEKVTLIKDIRIENPHRAHIEILFDLSFDELLRKRGFSNFVELHNAWQKTLDTKELNEKFYRELFNWYIWAVRIVKFPKPASDHADDKTHASVSIIRLLTRLIFIWFVKEKNLIPDYLFDQNRLSKILKSFDPKSQDSSTYYRAILQNLFFATLNTDMNKDKQGTRRFITKNRGPKAATEDYMDHLVYRYEDYFIDREDALKLFETIPFLNGGLFECLDYPKNGNDPEKRYDGFSSTPSKQAVVPDMLFFGQAEDLDFSEDFGGDKKKAHEKAAGIIEILSNYKFTITENTPLEEEIALDPELLGKVFENLLASYTPETQTTARKQTGSFYTPREIVDYMVDESLKAYLETRLIDERERHLNDVLANPESQTDIFGNKKRIQPKIAFKVKKLHQKNKDQIRDQLEQLFDYTTTDNPFYKNESDTDHLIRFISECKILDPACGSGAFPMGVLHRMVNLLSKLDPSNRKWKVAQLRKAENDLDLAEQMVDDEIRAKAVESAGQRIEYIRQSFDDECHELDYLRKLFLIENCIFGVDIQQIAVQISKLRFFISLVAEQVVNDVRENRGIISMPNLETKFVASNTLIGLEESGQLRIIGNEIRKIEKELQNIRKKVFFTKKYTSKRKLIEEEKNKRNELKQALFRKNYGTTTASQVAEWNPFDHINSAKFFDPEWMFGITGGFDIVIGNPPYGVKIPDDQLKKIKTRLKDTKNFNSAALFIDISKNNLLHSNGILSFIVPKSLLYSEAWQALAFKLIPNTSNLVDVETAFQNVLLEQAVFVFSKSKSYKSYWGHKFFKDEFVKKTRISVNSVYTFEAWICDITQEEIEIGQKIRKSGILLGQISKTMRGLPLQKQLRDNGNIRVIGGKNIIRYGLDGLKGFILDEELDVSNKKISTLLNPKIITQNIVAHIQNPFPHIKIISMPDIKGEILSVDTVVNTILTDNIVDIRLITALFNSTLINWYLYKFVFCSAIRTMHFDNYYINKIPLPHIESVTKTPIIDFVDKILSLKEENLYANTAPLEREIDRYLYELYGLSRNEISVVDRNSDLVK